MIHTTQRSANPRRDARFDIHRRRFLEFVTLFGSVGFEIGAFDLPMVEPEEGVCRFGDYRSTAELRELAAELRGHSPEFVIPVEFDLRQGYGAVPENFDWIVAAHVVEHVADLVGWLKMLGSKLKPNGILFLIVPDKRYTYDFHRRETNFTDVIAAKFRQRDRPSFEQVFDHYFYSANVEAWRLWQGHSPPPPVRDFQAAYQHALLAETQFEDAHCSVFTPASFVVLIEEMSDAKFNPFKLEAVEETKHGQMDFSVVLRNEPT